MIEKVLEERGSTYGEFKSNGRIAGLMKEIARKGDGWDALDYYEREAIDMILHKIARVVNGYRCKDNFVDIAGYATLVIKEYEREEDEHTRNDT